MTIQQIGTVSVALYLTPADLESRGFTSSDLTLEQTLQITRSAFAEAGIPAAGILEIEAFPDVCGVLVFAKLRPKEQVFFSFPNLEAVICAAHALLKPVPDAALTYWDKLYYLSLASKNETAVNILSEYGQPVQHDSNFTARLSEYGENIFSHNALARLAALFSPVV